MTPSIVGALQQLDDLRQRDYDRPDTKARDCEERQKVDSEPELQEPAVGKPISHLQVLDLWKTLKTHDETLYSLEQLLSGSSVYSPPPPPRVEPSDEYKALMARLRHEEAQRAYERMVNPPPKIETFNDRFPTSAQAFAQVNRPIHTSDLGDDDVTLNDVHRQVMLILNFLVSILGVAGTLWVLARWWSLPTRIFLTMGGSIVVAIAEVAVYSGYMWRMDQAKQKQKAAKEVKQVINTWVVEQEKEEEKMAVLQRREDDKDGLVRKRITAKTS
ncbi:hypothetical protein QQS21_010720 [Conoideocrella luteorostrata]|uniref:Endoplasmic reticulum-based factor for assembly of V-ATPase-domain-containing protein n=1 Tax=Conoideocrella luteorostrata TaxID=1105319 RepID=A0AAJ0CIX9_9HYPO|nr:hypothetical protein QQS21_010720 [Conoideocrella luteorostrata]